MFAEVLLSFLLIFLYFIFLLFFYSPGNSRYMLGVGASLCLHCQNKVFWGGGGGGVCVY